MRLPRRIRRTVAAVAITVTAALAAPGIGSAAPADDADAASRAIENAVALTDVAEPIDLIGALDTANKALTDLGLTPFFYPTAAINCSAFPGVPAGVVPAVAGAAAGPYGVPGIPAVPGLDTNLVGPGETLYAFVPAGVVNDSADKTGMQVAWFNVNTFQGGFVNMGGLGETLLDTLLARVPEIARPVVAGIIAPVIDAVPSAGVRLAPVDTGSGTVLAAVFGQVKHDDTTCAFFPTVGLTQVG